MKTCFASVIYKQARPFFTELISSVENQTEKSFDLLITNDNYTQSELESLGIPASAHLVDLSQKHLSIAGTRIEMLRAAKSLGYELVVIGDADDTFSTDRVELMKKAAELDKDSVFFYNKLVTDKGDEVFSFIPENVTKASTIAQENFLGMSTTAIRVDKLSEEFLDSLYEGDSPVFDWYLFTRILMDIGAGAFVPKASTIYRIYDNNMVGVSRDLQKEYEVKKIHYSNLSKRYDYFRYLLEQLEKVDLDEIKKNDNHQGYWWSDIKMEDSYEI